MATMFISPKYNVGERAAGGAVAFYTDKTKQTLIELWQYADLKQDSEGGGRIANPVPVDCWGINSSPVFMADNDHAWYVVSDAKGAIIREGYVHPYSWLGGGTTPDPPSVWNNYPEGDPFWGYEVVAGRYELAAHPVVDRPLWLALPNKRTGVVVWNVESSDAPDNVITFASQTTGILWKARDEYVSYSYLDDALSASSVYPIEFLETNWQGQYNILMDKVPSMGKSGTWEFSGNVRLDRQIEAYNTYITIIKLSDPSKLEIKVPHPVVGVNGLLFNVNGGDWSSVYTSTPVPNCKCILTGKIGTYTMTMHDWYSSTSFNFYDIDIDYLVDAQPSKILFSSSGQYVYKRIKRCSLIHTVTHKASDLAKITGLETVECNKHGGVYVDLEGSNGFPWEHGGEYRILLKNSGAPNANRAFEIKPSPHLVYDNSFYATNAEFYNVAIPNYDVINSSNPHTIGSSARGTLLLNNNTNGMLRLEWATNVFVENAELYNTPSITVFRDFAGAKNVNLVMETVEQYTNCIVNGSITGGSITFKNNRPANASFGFDNIFFELSNCRLERVSIIPQKSIVRLRGSSMDSCSIYNYPSDSSGWSSSGWQGWLHIMSNCSVTNCSFGDYVAGAVLYDDSNGDVGQLKNLKFNHNRAGTGTKLVMPGYSEHQGARTKAYKYWVFENVEIKGNNEEGSGLFIPVCSSVPSDGWMKGHIEVTGSFDLDNCKAQMPTTVFPDPGSVNGATGSDYGYGLEPINSPYTITLANDETIGRFVPSICLYTFGDPLKYSSHYKGETNNEDSAEFVTVTPWGNGHTKYQGSIPVTNALNSYWNSNENKNIKTIHMRYGNGPVLMYRIRE